MGFEPMNGFDTVNRLAGGPIRPLWHLPKHVDNRGVNLLLTARGGGRGIRTLGEPKPTTVFKTVAFVHSAIPP